MLTNSPDSLFTHALLRGAQQLDERGHSAGVDYSASLLGAAAGNVRQSPGGFKLKHGRVRIAKKLDQPMKSALQLNKNASNA
jgi:hypothetical protein